MFGERRSLILPILFDVANLVKTASGANAGTRNARTLHEDIERLPAAEFLKHSYIPISNARSDEHMSSVDTVETIKSVDNDNAEKVSTTEHLNILDILQSTIPTLLSNNLNVKDLKVNN